MGSKIYIIRNTTHMGHIHNEMFFDDKVNARLEFHRRIQEVTLSDKYASDDDCSEHNMMIKNGQFSKNENEFTYCYWSTTNDENGTESDLYLEIIEFEEKELITNKE